MWQENIIENDWYFVLMIDWSEINANKLINQLFWLIIPALVACIFCLFTFKYRSPGWAIILFTSRCPYPIDGLLSAYNYISLTSLIVFIISDCIPGGLWCRVVYISYPSPVFFIFPDRIPGGLCCRVTCICWWHPTAYLLILSALSFPYFLRSHLTRAPAIHLYSRCTADCRDAIVFEYMHL